MFPSRSTYTSISPRKVIDTLDLARLQRSSRRPIQAVAHRDIRRSTREQHLRIASTAQPESSCVGASAAKEPFFDTAETGCILCQCGAEEEEESGEAGERRQHDDGLSSKVLVILLD